MVGLVGWFILEYLYQIDKCIGVTQDKNFTYIRMLLELN